MTIMFESAVASSGAEDNARVAGGLDGGALSAVRAAPAEGRIDGHDIDAAALHHRRVLQGRDDCRIGEAVAVRRGAQCHQPCFEIHADDTQQVVPRRGNRSGDVRAVKTGIGRIRITIGKVVPVIIIHIAVGVVIKAVAGHSLDDDANGYVDDYYGYNFADGNANPTDSGFHGTHVAGTIAAAGNNLLGVIGVNFKARLMALRASSDGNSFTDAAIIAALQYATMMKGRGVNIVAINASFGGGSSNSTERAAIQSAGNAGIIFCAAAGDRKSTRL